MEMIFETFLVTPLTPPSLALYSHFLLFALRTPKLLLASSGCGNLRAPLASTRAVSHWTSFVRWVLTAHYEGCCTVGLCCRSFPALDASRVRVSMTLTRTKIDVSWKFRAHFLISLTCDDISSHLDLYELCSMAFTSVNSTSWRFSFAYSASNCFRFTRILSPAAAFSASDTKRLFMLFWLSSQWCARVSCDAWRIESSSFIIDGTDCWLLSVSVSDESFWFRFKLFSDPSVRWENSEFLGKSKKFRVTLKKIEDILQKNPRMLKFKAIQIFFEFC